MSIFNYFGSQKDSITLVQEILNNSNFLIIPEVANSKPEVYMTNQVDEFIEKEIWCKEFYLAFPMRFNFHERAGEQWYNFYRSPSLVFSTSNFVENEEGEGTRCVSGYLTYTKELYDSENNIVIAIPDIVKEEHKKIIKLLKTKLCKFYTKNRPKERV